MKDGRRCMSLDEPGCRAMEALGFQIEDMQVMECRHKAPVFTDDEDR